LFALDNNLQYPTEALKAQTSGTVTLAGAITPGGTIANVRVDRANVPSGEEGGLLSDAAMRNLSSWQFESRKGQDTIEIAYRYAIDRSLEHNLIDVKFELPSQIVIRAGP
jgi:TonB family protein